MSYEVHESRRGANGARRPGQMTDILLAPADGPLARGQNIHFRTGIPMRMPFLTLLSMTVATGLVSGVAVTKPVVSRRLYGGLNPDEVRRCAVQRALELLLEAAIGN
jgi:hypothetical protein